MIFGAMLGLIIAMAQDVIPDWWASRKPAPPFGPPLVPTLWTREMLNARV